MEHIITTDSLTKRYGKKYVVKNLDLCVPTGSIYGFLGPNGAGKSTTMKMLLGLAKPTEGEIRIFGAPVEEKNRLKILKSTGSLIESPAHYGHLSGRENLQIICTLKGIPESEIDSVLKTVRMENQQDKKVKNYSLGMKQRLGLAAALLGRPRLLLLDEPTNGLDPAGIQEMRELTTRWRPMWESSIGENCFFRILWQACISTAAPGFGFVRRTTGALTGSWRGSLFRCGRIQRMGSFFSIQRRTRRFSAAEGFCQNMISACSGWKSSR